MEGFYTDLRNVFILEEIGRDEDNNLLMERRNGKGARVMGINLEGKMAYSWMQIQAGRYLATEPLQRRRSMERESEYHSAEEDVPLSRTYMVISLLPSRPVKRFSASLTGTYTGKYVGAALGGLYPGRS